MAPSYKLWRAELKSPTPEAKRLERSTVAHEMSGFWMIDGARTKPAWPVAIWTAEGEDATIFQIGRKMMRTDTHPTEWAEFCTGSWVKCLAVEQKAWNDALGTGRWPDGRPAREITEAEKADIIPAAANSEGRGTNSPVDENGDAIDEFWLQIKEGLASCESQVAALGKIDSLETANRAAAIVERMRALGSQGEAKRKEEKRPWDEGAAKVQAKWKPVLEPASLLIGTVVSAVDKWKRAEERRLADEAALARRAEEQRLAAELAEQRKAEAAALAAQAEQMGMENQGPTEEEIEAEAAAEAAQQVAEQMPQADTKVRVGTAHGRAMTKPKIKRGVITDIDKFFGAIKEHQGTQEFLQQRANALARAGAPVAGMEIIEE